MGEEYSKSLFSKKQSEMLWAGKGLLCGFSFWNLLHYTCIVHGGAHRRNYLNYNCKIINNFSAQSIQFRYNGIL